MGEAKANEEEAKRAAQILNRPKEPTVTPKQVMVAMLLDMVCHTALGAARLIGADLQEPKLADELERAIAFIQKIRTRVMGEPPKVVLAPASAMPCVSAIPGLLKR